MAKKTTSSTMKKDNAIDKKMSPAMRKKDDAMDKKMGVNEGSARDLRMDTKMLQSASKNARKSATKRKKK